jgi:hypothetical protein
MLPRGRPSWLLFADVIFPIRPTGLRALIPQAGGHNISVVQPSTTWFWLFIAILRLLFDSSSYHSKCPVHSSVSSWKSLQKDFEAQRAMENIENQDWQGRKCRELHKKEFGYLYALYPLTAMKIQFAAFWVVTPLSNMIRYQRFGGPRFTLKMEAARPSETFVTYKHHYTASQRRRIESSPSWKPQNSDQSSTISKLSATFLFSRIVKNKYRINEAKNVFWYCVLVSVSFLLWPEALC